jgi:hypothetical protein
VKGRAICDCCDVTCEKDSDPEKSNLNVTGQFGPGPAALDELDCGLVILIDSNRRWEESLLFEEGLCPNALLEALGQCNEFGFT